MQIAVVRILPEMHQVCVTHKWNMFLLRGAALIDPWRGMLLGGPIVKFLDVWLQGGMYELYVTCSQPGNTLM